MNWIVCQEGCVKSFPSNANFLTGSCYFKTYPTQTDDVQKSATSFSIFPARIVWQSLPEFHKTLLRAKLPFSPKLDVKILPDLVSELQYCQIVLPECQFLDSNIAITQDKRYHCRFYATTK